MDLNYLAFFLIAFVPLIIGRFYFDKSSWFARKANVVPFPDGLPKAKHLPFIFLISLGLVYGFINLVVHQLGFYELFFTDIMKGSNESKAIVEQFLAQYGDKHRHFGHGILHGVMNAFIFGVPFVGASTLLEGKSFSYFKYYFGYWLITITLVCGLIGAFV